MTKRRKNRGNTERVKRPCTTATHTHLFRGRELGENPILLYFGGKKKKRKSNRLSSF